SSTTTTTTSTTSSTMPVCPPSSGLDDALFNESFSCEEQVGADPISCVDVESSQQLRFTLLGGGGGDYEVRHVPDDGVIKTGTLVCTTFHWIALAPDQYTEEGTW